MLKRMNSKVSIITLVYNAEKFVSKCITSVIAQHYENWEHIFVDDCSSDNSEAIIKTFQAKDKRIKYHSLKHNSGADAARNKGIKESSGRYLAFLDADFWHPKKLLRQIQVMQEKKVALIYSQYYIVKEQSNMPESMICSPERLTYTKMLRNDYIGFLTVMNDTHVIGKQYMPKIRRRQDWAYKLQLLKNMTYGYGIQEPLAYYRIGNSSLSSNKFKLLKYNFAIFQEVLGFSGVKSTLYMINFLAHYFYLRILLSIGILGLICFLISIYFNLK